LRRTVPGRITGSLRKTDHENIHPGDYHDTLRTLDALVTAGHEVTVWNDHVQDNDKLADRLKTPRRWC
jgi:hypothetical protein